MSYMKRWLEEHIDELSDAQLREMGYTDDDIKWFRECFSGNDEDQG